MKQGDPESIRVFKKSYDLLKWIQNNGGMKIFLVIMYSTVDCQLSMHSLCH